MKDIILYNSRKLFYTKGYFKTKISDITKESGVSTGKFYRCYNTKDDLLIQIVMEDSKTYKEEIQALIQKKENEIFKLKVILKSIFNFLKHNPHFFILLIELNEKKEKLSYLSKKSLDYFADEIKIVIRDFFKYDAFFDKKKGELLISMMEKQVNLYIIFLLTKNTGKFDMENFSSLSLEKHLDSVSTIVVKIFDSINVIVEDENIDLLTGAYTNKYFFELLMKTYNNGNSFNLIFLELKIFYFSKNANKEFFRDSVITDIGILLKGNFRKSDLIGRICPSKFMIIISEKDNLADIFNLRIEKIVEELKIKFSCISEKDITWKHIYMRPQDNILNKFRESI